MILFLLFGAFVELQNRAAQDLTSRSQVSNDLARVRAQLESNINGSIQLARGLVSLIATEPDISQERFSALSAGILNADSHIRHFAAAPDLVISMVHPVKGNEKAIGLDFRNNKQQRKAALRARDGRKMILAGPVTLAQGGQAFIARFPVFTKTEHLEGRFWGLVSVVIDMERLYEDSGLLDPDLPIKIAITGEDATGKNGSRFFGPAEVNRNNPVVADVKLAHGTWHISAIPADGWSTLPENTWLIRALILVAGILVVLPIYIGGQFFSQRRAHYRVLQQSQTQMAVLSQRLKLALDTSKIGVWEVNISTGELIWDDRMKELYGLKPEEEPKDFAVWRGALHPDDVDRAVAEFQQALASEEPYHSEFRLTNADGSIRSIRAIGAVNTSADGSKHIVGVNWDVSADIKMQQHLHAAKRSTEARNSELEHARSQMEYNALHDSLTGLPNRRYLDKILSTDDEHSSEPVALLHVDLDRFKQINDTMGHAAGDAILAHAASILKGSIRCNDFLARTGGDEFVIVLADPIKRDQLETLACRILKQMSQPVPYEGHECRFGASIGIARFVGGKARDRLLINADIALYRAKEGGRNRFEFFTDALAAEVVRNKTMADDMLNGLERGEFLPYFQPQFDAKTLDIVGVEALVRWDHPTEGLLSPDTFLEIAADLNVVPVIDRLILEQALWQATRWKANGFDIPKVSVNVSAGRLHDADLIESLDGLAIEPGTLSFELLESIFLDDSDQTIATNVEKLKQLGIDIEIDDFGTGYASIVSLLQLNPRRLKIDRQLVIPIVESSKQRRLVASIIDIGQSLGIDVTAEGVESMEHAKLLKTMGCTTLQGYAFSAPIPAVDLMDFVTENRWREVA